MTRKLTGSSLAAVLITLIAVKHLALGFCLCNEELFVSECHCCCFAEHAETTSCCAEEEAPAGAPSGDCIVAISLDAGDFLWGVDSFDPAQSGGTKITPAETPFLSGFRANDVRTLGAPIRGSPPAGPPLFLRTTVLRL